MRTKDDANLLLEKHLAELGLSFKKEYAFALPRKWRFDYIIWPANDVWTGTAIEIEGGIFSQGRHTRGMGYQKDLEKYREATAAGYHVYRFSTQEVLSGVAKEFISKHCL